MVRRGALERCETGANPLETREKRKPVTPENDPRETGLSFLNGGGGGSRKPLILLMFFCFKNFVYPNVYLKNESATSKKRKHESRISKPTRPVNQSPSVLILSATRQL